MRNMMIVILSMTAGIVMGQVIPKNWENDYMVLINNDTIRHITIVDVNKKYVIYKKDGSDSQYMHQKTQLLSWHDSELWQIPFQYNDAGRIEYQEVVELPGKTKDKLFTQARLWFAETFQDSKAVLEVDDREGGILVGTGWADTDISAKFWSTIKIEVKDGKYRYTINNFQTEAHPSQHFPNPQKYTLEFWFKDIQLVSSNKEKSIKNIALKEVNKLEQSIRLHMQKLNNKTTDW